MIRSGIAGMSDKDRMRDALSSQKYITALYNANANECEHINYKTDIMGVLHEEHQIHQEIFEDMKKRGWYQVTEAPAQKIEKAREKYLKIEKTAAE